MIQSGAAQMADDTQKMMHGEPYKGMQASSGGIFGMLEVILSDFARLEAETASAEDTQATNYQKFMDESNESIAVKDTEVEHKETKKRRTDDRNKEVKKEKDLTKQ